MTYTTQQARDLWGPPCQSGRGVTLTLNGGGRVFVDRRVADAVRALNACLVAWHYLATPPDVGAFACRPITGSDPAHPRYSLHAFLIAMDINWNANGYRTDGKVITDMPDGMVGAILAIRTNNGQPIWVWGGNYSGRIKDPMHWEERGCTPADLATGINWATVPGATNKVPYAWVPTERMEPGSHRPAVAPMQLALELLRPFTHGPHLTITTPPGYGTVTTESVRAFQKFARSMQRLSGVTDERLLIDVDGIWGPATAKAAKFWLPSASALAKAAA